MDSISEIHNLFNCRTCERKNYQKLLYEVIPENSNFTKARRKIILFFLLKEYALGFIIMGIMGFCGFFQK